MNTDATFQDCISILEELGFVEDNSFSFIDRITYKKEIDEKSIILPELYLKLSEEIINELKLITFSVYEHTEQSSNKIGIQFRNSFNTLSRYSGLYYHTNYFSNTKTIVDIFNFIIKFYNIELSLVDLKNIPITRSMQIDSLNQAKELSSPSNGILINNDQSIFSKYFKFLFNGEKYTVDLNNMKPFFDIFPDMK